MCQVTYLMSKKNAIYIPKQQLYVSEVGIALKEAYTLMSVSPKINLPVSGFVIDMT